ncbi:response regulator [Echinicola sp. CAU 1574]|uniref:histidine kinase n=1 Tax=Echinicola arenosa TaxID=2774144 RepID=A0ABR9AMQ8_9BACT|nr:response regulator [Echinicola arenosa]MBD8489985.1 response regulator [Echinicola arenosa]
MKSSLKITLVYIVIGSCWVAFSSLYLEQLQSWLNIDNSTELEIFKAVLFVFLSGLLIYVLVDKSIKTDLLVWRSYSTVFENIPMCMWIVDEEKQKIVSANKMAEEFFTTRLNGDTEPLLLDFFSMKEADVRMVFSGRNHEIRNLKIKDKKGELRRVDLYTVPFKRRGKNKVMVTAVDNTELHQNLMDKVELNDNLKKQNNQLRMFSQMNSHNIRRPLSNILGIIHLFESGIKAKEEVIDMLKKSSEDLDEEVNRMNEVLREENLSMEMFNGSFSKSAKSILIVDDDKVQHLINKRVLLGENPDLKLYFFQNPLDALSWLSDHSVDLLLLDINMPEMKGWEFLDKMIELGLNLEVKMLSSSIDPRDEEKSKQYDMVSGFLVKPLKKEALADIL